MPVAPLVSISQAQALVLERVVRLDAERVPVAAAGGRVLLEDARSTTDLPPFASSAMDGFALRAADTPGSLPVVARIAAGCPAERPLEAGEAMAIATGGVVPAGADAVVPIELVVERDNDVSVPHPVQAGANVRPRGGDVGEGDLVAEAGSRLRAAQLGALAAAGVAEVSVSRRPRVAVLATGTELRTPGEPLGPGEIYEANATMLAAALEDDGADVLRLPTVVDDPDAHRAALEQALAADVVVSSGGVSVGPHDLVRAIGAELGIEEVFWGVAMKPGKPVSFGTLGDRLVFGLPGNPVSSLVGYLLFVRPALLALQGAGSPLPRLLPGRLGRAVRPGRDRDQLLRARLVVAGDAVEVHPLGGQESHMIGRAAAAEALLLVPGGDRELEAGTSVRYLPL
jgi:molybdopterin molybdotransferase